jgi:hypothetical protein
VKVCKQEADCAPLHCEKTSGNCVDCLQDGHCQMGSICINYDCVEGCRGDRDCPAPKKCETKIGNGKCVECIENANCQPGYDCIGNVCVFRCHKEEDCAPFSSKPHCNLATFECVLCTLNSHCPKGYVCYGYNCLQGCSTTPDCAPPLVCDTSSTPGACVECVSALDCTGGKKCSSQKKCVECRDSNDCSAPKKFCLEGASVCVECRDNNDCGGLTCDTVNHFCRSPLMLCDATYCTIQAECPAGTLCTDYNGNNIKRCRPTCAMFGSCEVYNPYSTCSSSGTSVCSCFNPCKSSTDCLLYPGTWCDVVSGRCIDCDQSKKCKGGNVCRYNRCLACGTDAECKAEYTDRPTCITAKGTCVQCQLNTDCKAPGLPFCSTDGMCVQCTATSQCPYPQVCQDYKCTTNPVKKGACELCTYDTECDTGMKCRPSSSDGGTNLKCRAPCYDYYDCEVSPYTGTCYPHGFCSC